MKSISYFSIIFSGVVLLLSCSRDEEEKDFSKFYNTDLKLIKSETRDGDIVKVYKYNPNRTISEVYGTDFYMKYEYKKEFLEKITKYIKDEEIIEMKDYSGHKMLPQGEIFDTLNAYKKLVTNLTYDTYGRIIEKNTVLNKTTGNVQVSSVQNYYEAGSLILERAVIDESGIFRIYTYEYGVNENVKREYIYILDPGELPLLERTIEYTYDDKKNPFRVFMVEAEPGIYMNKNNIIKASTTFHLNTPPEGNPVEKVFTITYNESGYPFVVDGIYTYQYESK